MIMLIFFFYAIQYHQCSNWPIFGKQDTIYTRNKPLICPSQYSNGYSYKLCQVRNIL